MATIKSYTDLSQSKTLSKILPLESADMECILEQWIEEDTGCLKEGYCEIPVVKVDDDFPLQPITHPCWSLAALLGVIPNYELISKHNYHTCIAETSFGKETVAWFDNPVDACYKLIIKLKEKNLL